MSEEEAKELYRKIGDVPCAATDGEIVSFNSIGFHHLILKNGIRRNGRDIARRFALLPYVSEIVRAESFLVSRNEKKVQRREYRHKRKAFILRKAVFWKLSGKTPVGEAIVVIRQFYGGKKHFLSVYPRKNKKLPT